LTVYTSNAADTLKILSADFQKRYGIRVNAWRASSAKVLQRMAAEKTANRWDFDAVSVSSPELEALYRETFCRKPIPLHEEMLGGTMPAHRGWAPQFINVFVQAYNTRAVKKARRAETLGRSARARWKGMLGVEAKAGEWYCTLLKNLGEEKRRRALPGDRGAQRLVGAQRQFRSRQHGRLGRGAARARRLQPHDRGSQATRRAVDWFAIDPMIARSNGIGVSRNPSSQCRLAVL